MNSESNRNRTADRWQELAEQLGLGDQAQDAPAPTQAPVQAPFERQAPEVKHQSPREPVEPPVPEERHRPEPRRHQEEIRAESVPAPSPAGEFESLADMPPIPSESTPDTVLESESEGPLSEGEPASPRTAGRRRRRRRSGKNKKDAPEGEAVAQPVSETAPAAPAPVEAQAAAAAAPPQAARTPPPREAPDDESNAPRGRSRSRGGRRRRDEEPEVVEEPSLDEDEVHESGGLVGFEEGSEDEDIVNYSNWTVPSWKDLIGSLYRPER